MKEHSILKVQTKKLKLYAKDIEIAAKSHWTKQDKRKACYARLRECGNNMLRIEFTLKYQRSLITTRWDI